MIWNNLKELVTIQKREKLNDVVYQENVGPGGAYHNYAIVPHGKDPDEELYYGGELAMIQFQCGPRNCEDSQSGVIDTDLLEIVRHRLSCFQAGDFACNENAQALVHVEEALMWLNRRVEDRIERNVLGTNKN